jgi:hypothetical protein
MDEERMTVHHRDAVALETKTEATYFVLAFPKGVPAGDSVCIPTTRALISETERRHLVEMIEQALVEMETDEDISQGAVDGLVDALKILGVTYEVYNDRTADRE